MRLPSSAPHIRAVVPLTPSKNLPMVYFLFYDEASFFLLYFFQETLTDPKKNKINIKCSKISENDDS